MNCTRHSDTTPSHTVRAPLAGPSASATPLHYPRAAGRSKPEVANLSERFRTATVSG
jgi:hypothetical protein